MRVIENLPKMKISDMMQLWKNGVEILANEKRKRIHSDARAVLDAISDEWIRRGKEPFDHDEFFDWPNTDAPGGSGSINARGWIEEGVLRYMGYRVGTTDGLSRSVREHILIEVFCGAVPPVFPDNYLYEWGDPRTSQRLKKIAETIASLTRNAKRRRDSKMSAAIQHWEQDLEFLYYELYVEKFHFGWPSTETL